MEGLGGVQPAPVPGMVRKGRWTNFGWGPGPEARGPGRDSESRCLSALRPYPKNKVSV